MYKIFAYIWLKFVVNVGNYTTHGASGIDVMLFLQQLLANFVPWKFDSEWVLPCKNEWL